MSSNVPETKPAPGLTREELLRAIDFELSLRSAAASKHGITVWSIGALVVALMGMAFGEIGRVGHSWPVVISMIVLASWILNVVSAPWLRAVGVGVAHASRRGRQTFNQRLHLSGTGPHMLQYHLMYAGFLLALAAYVVFNAWSIFAILTCAYYLALVALIGFALILSRVRIPFMLESSRPMQRLSRLLRYLVYAFNLVPFVAVASCWPLPLDDFRLGAILAGLLFAGYLSMQILSVPPNLGELLRIRSALGLGQMSLEDAHFEIQRILDVTPEERYVTEKGEEVISALGELRKTFEHLIDITAEIDALDSQLDRASGSGSEKAAIGMKFRSFYRPLMRMLRSVKIRDQIATELKRELDQRIDIARSALEIRASTIKGVISRVDIAREEATAAQSNWIKKHDLFKSQFDRLCELQRGLPAGPKMKIANIYKSIFGT